MSTLIVQFVLGFAIGALVHTRGYRQGRRHEKWWGDRALERQESELRSEFALSSAIAESRRRLASIEEY